MPDVRLYLDDDGGEVTFTAGQIEIADGLETAGLLSILGGNEDDSGADCDNAKQWWGNLLETEEALKYRSRTAYLLRSIPAISGNLPVIEEAVNADLEWMLGEFASAIEVTASLPALRRVDIDVDVTVGANKYELSFTETWSPS